MSDSIGSRFNSRAPALRSSVARMRAAGLFAFAGRDESDLPRVGQFRCWEAVATLALTADDLEEHKVGTGRDASMSPTPGSAHAAIRDGLTVLGRLDLDLFADPRVCGAAKQARRALRSAPE